jgi:hypothetical protein
MPKTPSTPSSPQTQPKSKVKGSFKSFTSVLEFDEFFSKIIPDNTPIPNSSQTYKEIYDFVQDYTERKYIRGSEDENVKWFGTPKVTSMAEGLARERYLNMDDFNRVYTDIIAPRLQEILRKSEAELDMPKVKYNDLGLGTFDFGRASGGLIPLYKYYSFDREDFVEGDQVKTVKVGSKFEFKLKIDNSNVVLVPKILNSTNEDGSLKDEVKKAYKEIFETKDVFGTLKKFGLRIGGVEAFSSTIKKVYYLKEKVKKPRNAVRLFVRLGDNYHVTGEQYKWRGYLAIGVAQLLSILGYSVNIQAFMGLNNSINVGGGRIESGRRRFFIQLKKFDETIDKQSLLYVASDASFFRLKFFTSIIQFSQFYGDYLDNELGSAPTTNDMIGDIYQEFGKRDKYWNNDGTINKSCQFLYYVIPDCFDETQLSQAILDISLNIVNQNKQALEEVANNTP